MARRLENTLLLPDIAAQYVSASHSVSLRLLAYALQAFPLANPFKGSETRSLAENLNVMRLWADMLVARGENEAAATAWRQVALWSHGARDQVGATLALAQALRLLLEKMDPQEATATATGLIKMLGPLPLSKTKSEAMVVLSECLLWLGDIKAAKILQQEASRETESLRLDTTLLAAQIYLAEGQESQAIFLLDDSESNLGIFKDAQGARMALGMMRLQIEKDAGDYGAAFTLVEELIGVAKSEGLLLQEAMLEATRTELDAAIYADIDVITHGIQALKLFDRLNLGQARRVGVKSILAQALNRMGRAKKGIEYAEEVATYAHRIHDLGLEQEFTVIAADLAARDLQGIRAAGLYGSAADLYSEQPLLRARYLRKCAVQLMASAGSDREKTTNWALALMREAGDLLHALDRDREVAGELSAWAFDRLWIKTRR
ncbi:MAG: exopolyphosphatase [Mobiluncus sp.]|uniref:exopolyphosphatase n=1 Tax=Mobiluncus sp. TaxID=47293 RepID=UPI00258CC125|nr:exopolyphosphatase [Mobiluncus sp.]MCI6583605.1 exopolyphosphatase [Mobiluncus sp.]